MSGEITLPDTIEVITESAAQFVPELILTSGILVLICVGLLRRGKSLFSILSAIVFTASLTTILIHWPTDEVPRLLFFDMLKADSFSSYLKIIFDVSGLLTVWMSWSNHKLSQRHSEYFAILMAVVLGAHLLVMSVNFAMVFISLELISIGSYVLAGFAFSKKASEGSLKYFLFGSVSSAIMLYGMTMIYGLTGMMNFSTIDFAMQLINTRSSLLFIAALMTLGGFFFKVAATPFHPWAPDVYEAAPMPVVAFFSVVPKLAGIGILTRFILVLGVSGHSSYDWQTLISIVAMLSLTVGNFSALWQKNPKRLMAYSSIAQTGFLLTALSSFMDQGVQFMLFYASVYALVNFLVFIYLQYFESQGIHSLESFSGVGKTTLIPSVFILIGLIALTGLPPTAGFTSKLFVFSSLWESYQASGKSILLWLMVFGLLNTVISLFYYLRIPYFAFIKHGTFQVKTDFLRFENLLGLLLVLAILILFFNPGLLMGWINKINFVL
ncbi:MAG: NADH-quinone oxidoreductase subunit N [Chryseolinea sp.]